jgi:hypothetical protein
MARVGIYGRLQEIDGCSVGAAIDRLLAQTGGIVFGRCEGPAAAR